MHIYILSSSHQGDFAVSGWSVHRLDVPNIAEAAVVMSSFKLYWGLNKINSVYSCYGFHYSREHGALATTSVKISVRVGY